MNDQIKENVLNQQQATAEIAIENLQSALDRYKEISAIDGTTIEGRTKLAVELLEVDNHINAVNTQSNIIRTIYKQMGI